MKSPSWRITAIYVVVGGSWILWSDSLLVGTVTDPQLYTRLQTVKGWIFVAVTAVMLHLLIRRHTRILQQSDEALRESEKRFALFMQNLPGVAFIKDAQGRHIWANSAFERILGTGWFGKTNEETFLAGTDARLTENDRMVLTTGQPAEMVEATELKDGVRYWLTHKFPIQVREGVPPLLGGVSIDITERVRVEENLRRSEDRYRRLVESSPQPMAVVMNGKWAYVNSAAVQLLGARNPEEVIGKRALDFAHPDYHEMIRREDRLSRSGKKETVYIEFKAKRLDGQVIEVEVASIPITYQGRSASQVVFRDITERKNAEAMIRHQAYHDYLTGLPNRSLFSDRLALALVQSARNKQMLAVLFMDLDQFKVINDTLGHSVGDDLLKCVAERLIRCLRKGDSVGRMGGDEFTILLSGLKCPEDAVVVAQKILGVIRRPWQVAGHELRISASIGIAVFPGDGQDAETLMKNADIAMYRAKEQGKDRCQLYSPSIGSST